MYGITPFLPQIIWTDSKEHSGLDTDQVLLSKLTKMAQNKPN